MMPLRKLFVHPLGGLDEVVEPSAKVVANRTAKMAALVKAIEAGRFEPRPSIMRCPPCPHNLICPA